MLMFGSPPLSPSVASASMPWKSFCSARSTSAGISDEAIGEYSVLAQHVGDEPRLDA